MGDSEEYVSEAEQAQAIQEQQADYDRLQQQMQPPPSNNSDFTRWQLDTTTIVENLRLTFLGLEWDNKKGEWLKRGQAIMNQKGCDAFTAILTSHLSHIITLSDFTSEEIKRIALEIRLNIIMLIQQRYREFEIDKAYFNTVVSTIDHLAFAILKRALNGGERKHLGTVRKSVEQFVQRADMGQRERGLFSFLRR